MTFKVGDRVRIKDTEYTRRAVFWNPGTMFTIKRVVGADSDNADGDTQYIYADKIHSCGNTDVELYKREIQLYGIAKFCKEYYK